MDDRAPVCLRCRHRHRSDLRCWNGRYVAQILAIVLEAYGEICCHCRRPGSNSTEHLRPRSRGGTDQLDNLRPAHLRCNQERGLDPMPGYGARPPELEHSTRWP